jgi:hypothetical protein
VQFAKPEKQKKSSRQRKRQRHKARQKEKKKRIAELEMLIMQWTGHFEHYSSARVKAIMHIQETMGPFEKWERRRLKKMCRDAQRSNQVCDSVDTMSVLKANIGARVKQISSRVERCENDTLR